MAKNEIVLFTDGNTEIEVQISPEQVVNGDGSV